MTSTMSSSTSMSTNSTMAPLIIATPIKLVNQPLLLLSNMANMMAIKLDSTTIINPDYQIWKSKEKALLNFMSSALTTPIVALTVCCNSTMEVWKVLENLFFSISRSHVMNLSENFIALVKTLILLIRIFRKSKFLGIN